MSATAFAPATVANVAVGFDLLGFPVEGAGDRVTVSIQSSPGVQIASITGIAGKIPMDPTKNTATAGLLQMLKDLRADFGFTVSIEKGISMSSGMGGSAASAVAAVVAANALLPERFSKEALFRYAMIGESIASGGMHGDNIAPCLWGGLTLCRSIDPIDVVSIPTPQKILCVLVHPDIEVSTKESRGKLSPQVALKDHVLQSAAFGGFLSGCFKNDLELIRRSFTDLLIEPQRASQIPGFIEAKQSALQAGALGCSISGSGPSVFAWTTDPSIAKTVQTEMLKAFKNKNLKTESWISPIRLQGAQILS